MAKLFTNIAKNVDGLTEIYTKSSISSTVLETIRNVATTNPIGVNYVTNDMLRIEPAYDLYMGTWVPSNKQAVLTANKLQLGTTIIRKRPSSFYGWFPTNNPYIRYPQNSTKAENGSLVEIKPYSSSVVSLEKMKQDSPQVPLVSGPRDEKLMFKFLKTHQGISFLVMQQILQGGNTFKQSRKYDPTSILTATAKYTLANLSNSLQRIDRLLNVDTSNAGRLQIETVDKLTKTIRSTYSGGSQGGSNRTSLLERTATTAASRLKQDIYNRTNISIFGNKINLGQLGRTLDSYAQLSDALTRASDGANASLTSDQTVLSYITVGGYPYLKRKNEPSLTHASEKQGYISRAQENISQIKGKLHNNPFTQPYNSYLINNGKDSETYDIGVGSSVASEGVSAGGTGTFNGVTSAKYIKDPMNYTPNGARLTDLKIKTDEVDGAFGDIDFIKFKIVVPTVYDGGISFRAFLKDMKHNAKGDFEEQRYVGRPERFIVYKGMSRSVTFSLYLVAFSQNELSGMWTRANMLNKLVYPIGVGAGYMTPPIIRMTIGNILDEQPGYITDISMDFEGMPWDIDSEVTNVIQFNITYNIIEKNYITQDYNDLWAKKIAPTADTGYIFAENVLFDGMQKNENDGINAISSINIDVPEINPLAPLQEQLKNATTPNPSEFRDVDFTKQSPYARSFTTIDLPQYG